MSNDQKYLEAILEKIAAHERDKETQRARDHAERQQERRKYLAKPELHTSFSLLEQS